MRDVEGHFTLCKTLCSALSLGLMSVLTKSVKCKVVKIVFNGCSCACFSLRVKCKVFTLFFYFPRCHWVWRVKCYVHNHFTLYTLFTLCPTKKPHRSRAFLKAGWRWLSSLSLYVGGLFRHHPIMWVIFETPVWCSYGHYVVLSFAVNAYQLAVLCHSHRSFTYLHDFGSLPLAVRSISSNVFPIIHAFGNCRPTVWVGWS